MLIGSDTRRHRRRHARDRAVANSFFARTVGEIELAENDLRLKVRDIALRLQTRERTIAQRRSVRESDS